MSVVRRIAAAFGIVVLFVVLPASGAGAHPLGNFTVNTAAILTLEPEGVSVDYVIDAAEIPTVQAGAALDPDGDGQRSASEEGRYADSQCRRAAERLDVEADGRPIGLDTVSSTVAFLEGEAGLDTMRVECELVGSLSVEGATSIQIADRYAGERVGWHEIVVAGDRVTISDSTVAAVSSSAALSDYPEERLGAPLDVRSASLTATPGGPALGSDLASLGVTEGTDPTPSLIPGLGGLTSDFTDLVSEQDFTVWVAVGAALIAIVLGSLHAVAPGHGKTVMAAYLVGQRGSSRQALLLCAAVTLTHTAGVLILGTVLTVSTALASEQIYPVLGTLSGLIVVAVGVQLWVRTWRARRVPIGLRPDGHHGHDHDHDHDHGVVTTAPRRHEAGSVAVVEPVSGTPYHLHEVHSHEVHPHAGHSHHGHHHPTLDPEMGWRPMIAMGLAGGMVPSPSALVVLLGAIALGRTWFGAALVVFYGLGMSLTLIAAGMLLIRVRGRVDGFLATRRGNRLSHSLSIAPLVTAVMVVLGGAWIVVRAAWLS